MMGGMTGGEQDPDSEITAFLERMQAKIDARPPDGAFAEYCGKVVISSLDQVRPLPIAEAPDVIDDVMQTTQWGAPSTSRQFAQLHDHSSLLYRAVWTCLDEPATDEGVRVFSRLSGYVEELPANILDDQSEVPRAWMQKVNLLINAYGLVKQRDHFVRRAFDTDTSTAEMNAFADALVEHIGRAKEVIEGASQADLAAIIGLIDAYNGFSEQTMLAAIQALKGKIKVLPRQRSIPAGLYEVMGEASSHGSSESIDLRYLEIEVPLRDKLEQLQDDWTWTEINQVLSMYRDLESQETQVTVIDALEDATEVSLPGTISADTLAIGGLAAVIHHDIYKNVQPSVRVSYALMDKLEENAAVNFGDVSLPREMAPVTTVALLVDIAEKLPADDFTTVLQRMQETICGKDTQVDTTVNEWLLALALLRRSTSDEARERIDAFIAQSGFPHTAFQRIITGENPGNVYLLPGGKIRVDTSLSKGWVLATSSHTATVVPPEQDQTASAPSRYMGPDKGPMVAPGKQTTRRRDRQKARAAQGRQPEVAQAQEAQAPVIVLSPGRTLEEVGRGISPTDLAIVKQAISEDRQLGRHQLSALRHRGPEGALMYKMRVNGKSSGIRVILTHVGDNQFEIQTIKYRGAVYKDTLFK
jgi:hypothetical protein